MQFLLNTGLTVLMHNYPSAQCGYGYSINGSAGHVSNYSTVLHRVSQCSPNSLPFPHILSPTPHLLVFSQPHFVPAVNVLSPVPNLCSLIQPVCNLFIATYYM